MSKTLIYSFILVTVTCIISAIIPKSGYANQIHIGIYPPLITIQANPPSDITTPITLKNYGNDPIILSILIKTFSSSEKNNGEVSLQKNIKDQFLYDNVEILENHPIQELILSPGQEKRLLLHIIINENEKKTDHYFSILFISKDNQVNQTNTSAITAGIGVNVILAIGNDKNPNWFINKFSIPFFLEKNDKQNFILKIQNNSNHFIKTKGTIVIKNIFGKEVSKINLSPTIILAKSNRFLSENSDKANQTPWTNGILPGFYVGNLVLGLSNNNFTFLKTIHFLLLPKDFFPILTITLLVIIFIGARIKNYLKANILKK